MQVKSIAECSKGSILQYFRPPLGYHLSLKSLLCLFLSGRFRQVLLYENTIVVNQVIVHSVYAFCYNAMSWGGGGGVDIHYKHAFMEMVVWITLAKKKNTPLHCDQELPRSQTTDQPMALQGRDHPGKPHV